MASILKEVYRSMSRSRFKDFLWVLLAFAMAQFIQLCAGEWQQTTLSVLLGIALNFVIFPMALIACIMLTEKKKKSKAKTEPTTKRMLWQSIYENFRERFWPYVGINFVYALVILVMATFLVSLVQSAVQGASGGFAFVSALAFGLSLYYFINILSHYSLVFPICLDQELSILECLEESKQLITNLSRRSRLLFVAILALPLALQTPVLFYKLQNQTSEGAEPRAQLFLFVLYGIISTFHAVNLGLWSMAYNGLFEMAEQAHKREKKKSQDLKKAYGIF